MMRPTTILLFCLTATLLLSNYAAATTVTFDNAASGNNADLALHYGSNIAANATGFVTDDGTGATPNIGLTWLGNIPNEWEYHGGNFWNHESPVHVVQMDHGAGVPPTDNIAEVVFSPQDGRSVSINSFLLIGAFDQSSAPQVTWEVLGTGLKGSEIVTPGSVTGNPVNVGFTGVPGESYTLRFMHVPGSGGSGRGTALDDLSFSEVLLPGVPVLKLTVNRDTGELVLTNVSTTPAAIKGYSITSAAGSMNSTGWKSIADNYDASGDQSIDANDNWSELTAVGAHSDLSEFEFGGDGGVLGPLASVTLSLAAPNPQGIAWLKSPFEDVKLEVALVDTAQYSGASPEYNVEYVGGPAGGYQVGDLNFDDVVNALDWPIYNAGRGVDLSGTSQAAAYQQGDLDGDLDNDVADFVIFKDLFIAQQGAAAWAALSAVPEPASGMLLMVTIATAWGTRRRRPAVAAARAMRTAATPMRVRPGSSRPMWLGALVGMMAVALWANPLKATTITFATDPLPTNNADLPPDFGSNIAGTANDTANGFITNDGTGATPNIALQWAPTGGSFASGDANVLEFHSGPALTSGFTAPILQFDLNLDGQPALPADPTIDFTVTSDKALKLNSFEIGHATNQTAPAYAWTFRLIRLSDMAVVATQNTAVLGAGQKELVTFDYIGDSSEAYRLVFDDGGANTINTALDNVSFSEVVAPRLKLVVNAATGLIELHNDTGTDIGIDSYEITSASGSLNPGGWSSLRNAGVGGNGPPNTGQGWDPAGGVSSEQLIESYLLGESTISDGLAPISLGTAFDTAGGSLDLKFGYHVAGEPGYLRFGEVEYVGSIADADFDDDANVDGHDFLIWQRGFGTTGSATNAQGDANDDNNVDGLDLAAWEGRFGAGINAAALSAVPEPAAASMLIVTLAGALIGLRPRRTAKGDSMLAVSSAGRHVAASAVLATCFASFASAEVHLDRFYQFGDGGSSATADSEFQSGTDQQDLEIPFGSSGPSYVNVAPTGLARPGALTGDKGAQFNGVDQVLSAIPLNRPDETVGPTFLGLGPDVFSYPYNYDTITARGLQMWVYPESTGIGTGRQGIVMDTIAAGGVAITADGKWTQSNDSRTKDSDIETSVPVVGDQWYHVMHHIHLSGTPDAPRILAGQFDLGFTGVVYVDGVAVSANNGEPALAERNDDSRVGVLVVGAEEVSGNGFEPSFGNYFDGVVDDLKMYVYGDNSFVATFPAGQDYGTFDLFADNDWISDQVAQIPNGGILRPGDINRDGLVNAADETALRQGWMREKRFEGAINTISVGDWETWAWGDLNTDGIVNLDDAIVLDDALTSAGAAGVNFAALFNGVPEPSTFMLTASLLLLLAGRRVRETEA